jgi:hypothetical protein
MRIIKPYGRSHVERDATGGTRRGLRERTNPEAARDIEKFARSHNRLVIAQWVSVIDKIASKPAGTTGPTPEQREFRDRLGQAAWTFLEVNKLLSGFGDPAASEFLGKIWKAKIAPYGSAVYRAPNRPGRAPPSARGRWYERFAGSVAVAEVDAAAMARKIYEHLYVGESRNARPKRAQGLIIARARSIAANVPHVASHRELATGWTDEDRRACARAGNMAQEIRDAVRRRETGGDKAGTKRVSIDVAAAVLFKYYARLFRGADGRPLSIREARERSPGPFNLHMAVKDCYAHLLDHQRKARRPDARGPRSRGPSATPPPRGIADRLPDSMEALFALVDHKSTNRELNALVRVGKIIHYTASGNREDRTAAVIERWPADIANSIFWTSDGQAVIKRNEAFVRVWRHVLALASRTLMDWADPEGTIRGDILLRRATDHAVQNLYAHERYARKLDLLFGNRAHLFKRTEDDTFERGILRLALEGTAELRNSAFHFKGLGDFADALTGARLSVDAELLSAVRVLWEADVKDRAGQLLQAMRAAFFEYFLSDAEALKFAAACGAECTASLPLPRFAKLLRRAANAWSEGEDDLHLPKPANRMDLQNAARLCQYTAVKLLYELVFRPWLYRCTAEALNAFIDRAVMRSTTAARDLNAAADGVPREVIVAKAAALSRIPQDGNVETFFFDLSAETATEMRVQRGYASDPDAAREQAAYIENLKCDVVALAFRQYLKESDFEFLLDFSAEMRKPEKPLCDLGSLPVREPNVEAEPWQVRLYFVIHLVPVEGIGLLLHQLRKWEILAAKRAGAHPGQDSGASMKARVTKLQEMLELYLDMHDAKFQGGMALIGGEAFKVLFESDALFDQLFPKQGDDSNDRRIPRRGLREIMRFGHLGTLRPLFERHPVKHGEVTRYLEGEALQDGKPRIARWQESREALHEKWTEAGRDFPLADVRSYVEALSNVVRHRHLASHVTLTDHVRLHRLLMAILGRLVDYAALWERDLYFAILGLIHHTGAEPAQVFTAEGLRFLRAGRVARALRTTCWQASAQAQAVADGLRRHFGSVFEGGSAAVRIRNDFTHFNMLKPGGPPVDLTEAVNAARHLMAYDRKLKNAVSQSIKEKMQREGLTLNWTLDESTNHYLGPATLQTRQARHLGRTVLRERSDPGASRGRAPRSYPIAENLHSDEFVGMVASLFANCIPIRQKSSLDLPFDKIEWRRSSGYGGRGSHMPPGARSEDARGPR